ncbi:protein EDS1-like [Bidens hawaiensis]|uniref:protein EDS1-like n=1 Tax=Bidens hawaiensis TaxID=980011 RepID=UPI00404A66D3
MEVERDSIKLDLSNDLIKDACSLSMKAHNNQDYYVTNTTKKYASSSSKEVFIIAFKGSFEVDGFYKDDHFGETAVDDKLCPSLQRIGQDLLGKVNGSLLITFQNLLNNSGLKSEVEKAVKEGKKILFAGHSFGGAIASLATLWLLDEYTRKQNKRFAVGCVTFGSPLIGDGTVTHAVRREKWTDHFTHFVLEHDIVPRMMLAPKTSVQNHLPGISKFFQDNVNPVTTQKPNKIAKFLNIKKSEKPADHDPMVDDNDAEKFFENVLINASTVASHDAYDLMEPTNSLKEKLSADFVKVSPYRPLGRYVFCTQGEDAASPRQQLVVENPNAVLQLLFYFLQLPNEDQDSAQFAVQSLHENFGYEEEINKNGLQIDNRVNLKDLNNHLLTSNGATGDVVRTKNKALFELATSAKWCLLAAEEAEKRKKENEDQIKESMRKYKSDNSKTKPKIIEDMIDEILKYKQKHDDGAIDYYEAFKLQNEHDDFKANVNRLEQAKIWDVVMEMVVRKDLPDEFEVWDELVELATQFRRLYEPLDIANYYRHLKGEDNKGLTYMQVRPKRYKFTQRWFEHANVTGFEKGCESTFVADVEEFTNEIIKKKKTTDEVKKTTDEVKKGLESIHDKIKKWQSDEKIANADVLWGKSALSKLEATLANSN